jgi:hypothetical protein
MTHLAATLADCATSYYAIDVLHVATEQNKLITVFTGSDKKFGIAGIAIKLALWSAVNVPAYYRLRRIRGDHPPPRMLTIVNFGAAGYYSALAARTGRIIADH